MNDARFNHWPIAASNLRGSRVVCQAKFSSRDTLVCVSPTFTYTSPAILTPATEENRYVAVMFIEHDFGGFAGIKHELDCFNELERVNPTDEFAVRYRGKGTGVTENENLICRSIPSVALCVAICPPDVNS